MIVIELVLLITFPLEGLNMHMSCLCVSYGSRIEIRAYHIVYTRNSFLQLCRIISYRLAPCMCIAGSIKPKTVIQRLWLWGELLNPF